MPGSRPGLYELAAQIGKGGMGGVYRALDTNLGRQVAIRILPGTFAHPPVERRRPFHDTDRDMKRLGLTLAARQPLP